jgi:hypothetical protein
MRAKKRLQIAINVINKPCLVKVFTFAKQGPVKISTHFCKLKIILKTAQILFGPSSVNHANVSDAHDGNRT